jgi:hypothetical protein
MFTAALTQLAGIDPLTADLIWTAVVSGLVLSAGGVALAMLPWSDAEIARVDHSFKALASLPAAGRRAPARR